jgi:hypothetical protein
MKEFKIILRKEFSRLAQRQLAKYVNPPIIKDIFFVWFLKKRSTKQQNISILPLVLPFLSYKICPEKIFEPVRNVFREIDALRDSGKYVYRIFQPVLLYGCETWSLTLR